MGAIVKALGQGIPFTIMPFMVEAIIGQECMEASIIFGILALMMILGTLLALPFWRYVANKVGKFKSYVAYHVAMGVATLLQLVHNRDTGNCTMTYVALPCLFIWGFALGGGFVLQSLVADCVDYDEFLSGQRREAMYMMSVDFLTKFMEIPGEVLPLLLMASYGYARPPLVQPPCSMSNYTNTSLYTGLSLNEICAAYYAGEPAHEDWCSNNKRCADVLADGVRFVCNGALGTCGVAQNDGVSWVLRISFSV